MRIAPPVLLVFIALLAPASADPAFGPPAAAVVTGGLDEATVSVSWAPALGTPTGYRVYGLQEGSWALLGQTASLDFTTERGYAEYAVSAVYGELETERVVAINGDCIYIDPGATPPRVYTGPC